MKKERFTGKRPVGTKKVKFFLNPQNGAKLAMVSASNRDASDWWYIWDYRGEYKGCANSVKNEGGLKEIDKETFLTNA